MEIVVEQRSKVVVPEVGDILEFYTSKGDKTYYLVCATNTRSKNETQYFIVNLNGRKGHSIKFYDSLYDLVEWRDNDYEIYSGDESRLILSKAK